MVRLAVLSVFVLLSACSTARGIMDGVGAVTEGVGDDIMTAGGVLRR
jgi:predicted small secreted protein